MFEEELKIIHDHEPNLFKAVNNIFKDSYSYTREYKEFVNKNFKKIKEEAKTELLEGQTSIEDFI